MQRRREAGKGFWKGQDSDTQLYRAMLLLERWILFTSLCYQSKYSVCLISVVLLELQVDRQGDLFASGMANFRVRYT